MELPHDRGHSKDRGLTERLPAVVLDGEVEEHIEGSETSFWDKRTVEQGLVIDSLSLPGNEPVWIFRRGWYRPQGGARSLSFCEGPPPGPTPTEGATHHCGTPSRLTVSCPGLSPWLTCSCLSGTSHFRISGQIPIDHFFRLRESLILRAKEI